ncbi:MAG: 30S ribosomal protein S13 [Candidatus Xenolissoclinum pacificiensis L6]|uniref:Small ribosomal subunit protein uS13 n=1 Tax=Candidatus Xenolissoclinum pacificiensis L6 TaxID=1401685 RepID=W2UZB8_9RICK|nr:MAG: 30S ribosomal protein S13 [Candidatus Xenolissoclinum pacificiensis L6]
MRLFGIKIPNKNLIIGLTYIYGIGIKTSEKICSDLSLDCLMKVDDLVPEDINRIREYIEGNSILVEGDLRKEVSLNIKRKKDLRIYAGLRHSRGLPVRGQRTNTNARTRKGRVRIAIAGKKKV